MGFFFPRHKTQPLKIVPLGIYNNPPSNQKVNSRGHLSSCQGLNGELKGSMEIAKDLT